MAKCRKLLSENEELGRIISSGNVAQLEHDLAYHKQLLNEACENEQSNSLPSLIIYFKSISKSISYLPKQKLKRYQFIFIRNR